MTERNKIGILGGTFNPIHYGHLRFAEAVAEAENMFRVIFVPSFSPPFKNIGVASFDARLNMIQRALRGNHKFWQSTIEENLPCPSYTYNTVWEMVRRAPNTRYVFITGIGSWFEMAKWHRPFDLLGLCDFVFVNDGYGVDTEEVECDGPQEVIDKLERLPSSIYNPQISYQHPCGTTLRFIAVRTPHIRSTDVRLLRSNNKSIRYLVPDSVFEYIEENKLYLPQK